MLKTRPTPPKTKAKKAKTKTKTKGVSDGAHIFVVSCSEDVKASRTRTAMVKLRASGAAVVSAEFILSGALTQSFDAEAHALNLDG